MQTKSFLQITRKQVGVPSRFLSLALAGCCAGLLPEAASASNTQSNSPSHQQSRAVKVVVRRGSLLLGAMVAKGLIDLNGNNIASDSYDSSSGLDSTNGQYDPKKAGDNGNVATNLGVTNSINAGNANIYGHVQVGPNGAMGIGPNGGVGAHSWQASNTGVETGWFSQDANFTFPDTGLPYGSGLNPAGGTVVTSSLSVTTNSQTSTTYPNPAPASGVTTNIASTSTVSTLPNPIPAGLTTNVTLTTSSSYPSPAPMGVVTNLVLSSKGLLLGFTYTYPVYTYTYPNYSYTYALTTTTTVYATNTYDHVLNSGDYYATSLSGKTIVLGQARLVLPNGFNMANKDALTIAPGASISIFADGTSASVSGQNISNPNGYAGSFSLSCSPNVTSVSYSGNASFTGVLVAPYAQLTMNGGGSTPLDFQGAIMANTIKMNGHFNFHFDQALRNARDGRFLVTSWNEIAVGP